MPRLLQHLIVLAVLLFMTAVGTVMLTNYLMDEVVVRTPLTTKTPVERTR